MTNEQMDLLSINTIRTLSMDAVQAANSGHPGTPMALAPLVYTLWNRVMRFDPKDPIWPNRDRFVLSNGHASMLLWSVLHLTGVQAVNADYEKLGRPAVTLDDILSMPSWDLFESQSEDYRNSVLPQDVRARVAIEQASTFGWERYVGREGHTIGMHTFGASAPLKALQQEFGFTVENIVAAAKAQLPKK